MNENNILKLIVLELCNNSIYQNLEVKIVKIMKNFKLLKCYYIGVLWIDSNNNKNISKLAKQRFT